MNLPSMASKFDLVVLNGKVVTASDIWYVVLPSRLSITY